MKRKRVFAMAPILALSFFAAAGAPVALAAAPPNDNFAMATSISPTTLPFTTSVVIDGATLEAGEPSYCYPVAKSVWYSITPAANGTLRADVTNSSLFDRFVFIYQQTGTGLSGLTTTTCASPNVNGQSSALFTVSAGTTYYLQAGGLFASSTRTLNLAVQAIPPPVNANFGSATRITSLPFTDNVDTTAATTESGEPFPCGSTGGTVWYSYTAAQSGSLTATANATFSLELTAYTGSALGSLTSTGCNNFMLTIQVTAGTTYYFQAVLL